MDVITQVEQVATTGLSSAWLLVGNFLVLVVLTVVLLMFAMRGGRSALISLILALYGGYAIYIVFPYTENIVAAGGTPLIQAVISVIVFGIATIAPFILIRRITSGGFGSLSFIPNLLLAFLTASFLLALGYHVFDISNIYSFPAPLDNLFAPKGYFFWWFIAPLIGLFVLAR